MRKVLITGGNGFVAKNLKTALKENQEADIIEFNRGDSISLLNDSIKKCDIIVHLAGENRPTLPDAYRAGNVELTEVIIDCLKKEKLKTPVVFSSSAQAELDNPYGKSKKMAENLLCDLSKVNGNPILIYRLTGVFGKWCKPNYNSVVATFCHNIARNIPISISKDNPAIELIYIDDLIGELSNIIQHFRWAGIRYADKISPSYTIKISELADKIQSISRGRKEHAVSRVGAGLMRALYSTYLSYLPPEQFTCKLEPKKDPRGSFVEVLKTTDSGQFSFFTAKPGITRGGHFHHTKTEKFIVLSGSAKFRFQHIISKETYEILVDEKTPLIVDSIPGWAHDITNIGEDDLIVMLWANEIFDKSKPDTFMTEF